MSVPNPVSHAPRQGMREEHSVTPFRYFSGFATAPNCRNTLLSKQLRQPVMVVAMRIPGLAE